MTNATMVRCGHCGKTNRVPVAATGSPGCGNCHQPLPWIVDAGDDDFAEIAENAVVPVLVDLWAPWCGPCRLVSPILEQLAGQMAGQLKLVKVNVDVAPALGRRYSVQGIPTLLMLYRGQEISRQVGAAPAPTLHSWAHNALASSGASRSSRSGPRG
jgi:thioredoxin 2